MDISINKSVSLHCEAEQQQIIQVTVQSEKLINQLDGNRIQDGNEYQRLTITVTADAVISN